MEWRKKAIAPDAVKALAQKYGCDLLTASIFIRRGITKGEEIRYFLESDLRHLRNPFELPGMEDAVERVLAAREEGEKVLVFGDRDVDGITGTVVLVEFLRKEGVDAGWRIPVKDEPYGLTTAAVEEFAAGNGTLIITVDCGISCRAEIDHAASFGIDVIVTDHHNPGEKIPNACALVNPKLSESTYPFKQLSGCVVAYKLVSALRFALKSKTYGQHICLLNVRPGNDAFIIEAAKMRNLAVIDILTETVVPGMVGIYDTRLPAFLSGQQILCWDVKLQTKQLANLFGNSVDFQMLDIAGEVAKEIPQSAGKSLFRLKEESRIGRYTEGGISELDTLINLFIGFIQRKEKLNDGEDDALQLAALGTIADIMPLRDENRLIVKAGMAGMLKKTRRGLQDLFFKQNISGKRVGAEDISWQLTPVINAAGRMGSPEKAAELLLSENAGERDALANSIVAMNEERKQLCDRICIGAEKKSRENLERFHNNLAVTFDRGIPRGGSVADGGIPHGLTGLVASRMASLFKIPALVVAIGETIATGSFRSAREYNLGFLMEQCSEFFIDWGGHDYAAGFSMEPAVWDGFYAKLTGISANMELNPEENEGMDIDAELPPSYLSKMNREKPFVLDLCDRFEPYGEQNRSLCFITRKLKILDITLMGREELKHCKLILDSGALKWPAIFWNGASRVKIDFDKGDIVDVVYHVNRDFFNGSETPQMIVEDIRLS
ncbi:MAG: single-stranded-DNA-specific exonuclease RecJ [Treponema sp.]|jgi:single-stranded-DNA-specific exonuclease|nr:single-stranded-DNA-specific exonuclease RecJ [Treponema sp.]